MAAITMSKMTTKYGGVFGPFLVPPDESQGADGLNLQGRVTEIIQSYTPVRSLPPKPSVILEPDPAQVEANQPAIALLRSWRETGDAAEQAETWRYLQQVLDEDRLSNRPLF